MQHAFTSDITGYSQMELWELLNVPGKGVVGGRIAGSGGVYQITV